MPTVTNYINAALLALLLIIAGITIAASSPSTSQTKAFPAPIAEVPFADLASYDDAIPLGVDPIVTGPVSTAFKAKQKALNCHSAVWPSVPSSCYPD